MKNYFVNYNQALALKEIGFDEPSMAFYQVEYTEESPVMVDDDSQYRLTGWRTCRNSEIPKHYTSAPLKSQVLEWFRNVHQLFGEVHTDCTTEPKFCYAVNRFIGNPENLSEREWKWEDGLYSVLYRTRELAEDGVIDYLIDIVKYK